MKKQNHSILFVCHGNICRSPMAEFVMKDLVRRAGLEALFTIASAATSNEEIGNPVYPPARRKLAEHGISSDGKTARRMTAADYDRYDLLIGMDSWNIANMQRICGGDPQGKIFKLTQFLRLAQPEEATRGFELTDSDADISDPWYTGDFETTWRDVLAGCKALLAYLISD